MYLVLNRCLHLLRRVEKILIVAVFLVMVFLFSFSVLVREFPSSIANEFAWIEEAVKIMNLFLVFITLGLALERGKHVSISTLREKFTGNIGFCLVKAIDLVGLSFSLYLFYLGVKLTLFVAKTGQVSPTLDISMAIVYLAPVLGFLLLSLRYFLSLIGAIQRYGVQQPTNNVDESSTNTGDPS